MMPHSAPLLLAAFLLLLAQGCPKDPPCTPGSAACSCRDGNVCDTNMACQSGICQAAPACTPGTLDCACTVTATCGTGLVCNNATCRAREAPLQGEPGGPCYPNSTCNSGYECAAMTCQDPTCPAGSVGCPCTSGQTCADNVLSCQQGTCAVAGCTPGTQGCFCDVGVCRGGLQCTEDFCRGGNTLKMYFTNANVRACELVFEPTTRAITGVTFGDSVIGEQLEKRGRVAVAFTAERDQALPDPVMELTLAGTQAAAAADAVPGVARCVNGLGQPVAAPGLTFR